MNLTSLLNDLKKLGIKPALKLTSPVFSTVWDTASMKDMGDYSVTGALALTSNDINSVLGGFTQATLIADGTHIPTFDGATIANYVNTANAHNRISLTRVGNTKFWTISQITGTAVTVPAAPSTTGIPTILLATVGSALTWQSAPGITGSPTPTSTYDILVNGSVVASNAVSGSTYTPVNAGDTIVVRQNITNTSGTIQVLSSSISAVAANAIGGITPGTAGTGIYSNFVLSDGLTFNTLSLVTASTPTADLFTSRGYSSAGAYRAPPTGALSTMVDASPDYSGFNDSNRGVPLPTLASSVATGSHQLVSTAEGPALRLHTTHQFDATEMLKLATGVSTQVERGAMIHTSGRLIWNGPAIIEWRAALPPGPRGQHPTLWALSSNPIETPVGNEYGFESNGAGSSSPLPAMNAYFDDHVSAGQINASGSTANVISANGHDGNLHTFTIVLSSTNYKYYIDGNLVNTIAVSPDQHGNQSDYMLLTNHIYTNQFPTGGESYVASDWTAATNGVNVDLVWFRVWRAAAATHYVPVPAYVPADIQCSAGQGISIPLPSTQQVWGTTGITDYVQVIPNEVEEPGSSQTAGWNQFPSWLAYNSSTRTLSGTVPNQSGALHFALGVVADAVPANGCTCRPARFRLTVAPIYNGPANLYFTNGQTIGGIDVYAMWDMGRLFQTSSNKKGLTVSGLPAGLSFNGTTGLITGTASTVGTGTITISATNIAGQVTSQSVNYSVVAAVAGGVPIPTGITGTLATYWDPSNAPTITQTNGQVTALASAFGSANITLTNSVSTGPTLETILDGNNNPRPALRFTAALGQFLQANAVASTGDVTYILVYQPATTTATQWLLETSAASVPATRDRESLTASTTSGYGYRKNDDSNNQSAATAGTAYTPGLHLLIGRSSGGASQAAKFNLDGAGTAIVASVLSASPSSLTWTTLGGTRVNGVVSGFMDGHVLLGASYATNLSDADVETLAQTWATPNFGTLNLA